MALTQTLLLVLLDRGVVPRHGVAAAKGIVGTQRAPVREVLQADDVVQRALRMAAQAHQLSHREAEATTCEEEDVEPSEEQGRRAGELAVAFELQALRALVQPLALQGKDQAVVLRPHGPEGLVAEPRLVPVVQPTTDQEGDRHVRIAQRTLHRSREPWPLRRGTVPLEAEELGQEDQPNRHGQVGIGVGLHQALAVFEVQWHGPWTPRRADELAVVRCRWLGGKLLLMRRRVSGLMSGAGMALSCRLPWCETLAAPARCVAAPPLFSVGPLRCPVVVVQHAVVVLCWRWRWRACWAHSR
mmetsp:Transcript_87687/g.225940  ORF Transcript_87687/g.225940 Transcript_87687/m.225940 type:complete len:300 (+) Transcript_87687:1656-2555(+)